MINFINKYIPISVKKKLRYFYHSNVEIYLEKIKFFNCELSNNKNYIDKVKDKNGLEIGGPSFFFRNFIKIYENINSLDNLNFKNKTIWRNNKNKNIFMWNPKKKNGKEIICCSTDMSIVPNESYDFVLSSHQLEHVANPIKALFEFRRVLKKSGILILVLPNSKYNFDHKRDKTTFKHLLEDFNSNMDEGDLTHLKDSLDYTDFSKNYNDYENFKKLAKDNFNSRVIHHHIFDNKLISDLCNFAKFNLIQSDEIKKKFPSLVFLCEKN
jgi:SAM-dependent methyltransferase